MPKIEYKSKYFGNLIINVEAGGHAHSNVIYNEQEIQFFFYQYSKYKDKLNICLNIIDKYLELNDVSRKAIVDNFSIDSSIKGYFECQFDILECEELNEIFGVDELDKLNIKDAVAKLNYPNLLFSIEANEIGISVDYMVSKEYTDEILCVKMDEELNVQGFSHES